VTETPVEDTADAAPQVAIIVQQWVKTLPRLGAVQ